MAEPTSILTFQDLIIEVARKIGVASYGATGDGVVAIPTDARDLDDCKRHVNNGIRMFINDGPRPNGWRWLNPVATLTIWGNQGVSATKTVTGGPFTGGTTVLTANVDSFYPTMEFKDIVITGVGTFNIESYTSATQVTVTGDASTASSATWSMTADGNYVLPQTFGGQYTGEITYGPDTNQGIDIRWQSETMVRQWREDVTDETGDPYWAAVRPMTIGSPRRRWELLVYPKPDEVMILKFPYTLHFNSLVNLTDVPPSPIGHDEAVKAACLAVAEKDVEGMQGPDWEYYTTSALPASHRIDALSAPKRLGYFGNPTGGPTGSIHDFRRNWYDRPPVGFNT